MKLFDSDSDDDSDDENNKTSSSSSSSSSSSFLGAGGWKEKKEYEINGLDCWSSANNFLRCEPFWSTQSGGCIFGGGDDINSIIQYIKKRRFIDTSEMIKS